MHKRTTAEELLSAVLLRDRRYSRDAYVFVSESLGYTVQKLGRKGHVAGRELCEGLRDHALEQFGRMARVVLESWGVRSSEDIGNLVFNMVEAGLLRKTEEDRREDFRGVLDFEEAFER
ncbi:MAG TPA: Minf_1886 family protein, partial [Phycisphaerae bacterium]|nr:Minf_1886 family protein [Phycisphaerae bacterium]